MNLVIVLLVLVLVLLLGLGGFIYKVYSENEKLKDIIRNNHKQTSEELKHVKRDLTSINSSIKDLTKIEELE